MHIERVPVASLNPAPYNPRKDLKPGDPEFERLRRSVDEFGLVEPLVWNRRTGVLVGGRQHLKIMIERGDMEVEVSVVDLTLEREKALNLALNKIRGDWDSEKLAALLADLCQMPDFDGSLSGFEEVEVGEILRTAFPPPENADDFDAEAELAKGGPTITQPGDMIVLGSGSTSGKGPRHILLCGDCTDAAQVRRLIEVGGGTRAALFARRHEPCFFGWVKGNKPRRAPGEPMLSTVWEFDTIANGAERSDHPTPKPVALFELPMRQHTRPGDVQQTAMILKSSERAIARDRRFIGDSSWQYPSAEVLNSPAPPLAAFPVGMPSCSRRVITASDFTKGNHQCLTPCPPAKCSNA